MTLTIDTESDPGSWDEALRYPPYVQIADDTFTNGFVARPAEASAPRVVADVRSFHAGDNTDG